MDKQSVLIWQSLSFYVLSIKRRTDLEAQSGISTGELWYSPSTFLVSARGLNSSTHSQEWPLHYQRKRLENKVVYQDSNVKAMHSHTNNLPFFHGLSSFSGVGLSILQLCKSRAGKFFFVLRVWANFIYCPFWALAVNYFLVYPTLR